MKTIAVYSNEDRYSMHRYKADEAWEIAPAGKYTPVGAYLAIDAILDIAKQRQVDMIHPGYGFLSENAEFAAKVREAGMAFVGPPASIIAQMGDKTSARRLAIEAGVPVIPGSDSVETYEQAKAFCDQHGFPVIIKSAFGGGGRGMRVVREAASLENSFIRARSEALQSFGNGTVFLERFLDKPKHIEVQLLGDREGNIVHLFERDCSVQRRHQKVVEVAPAAHLSLEVRNAILADALKLARHVKYENAGTAEFLVDSQNRHYFIEINPRIQVEHTITEEITGVDIVAAQIRIAAGATLATLGLTQDKINYHGHAIQCRITTEDPMNQFAPDTGRIEVYRSSGGKGVRLDGGAGYAGAQITPHYDSLLVKATCTGDTYEEARRKTLRALVEFRIRGVKTNIPFLVKLLNHSTFVAGDVWTTFIDDTPELFVFPRSKNRATRLLNYLADMVVNGSQILGQMGEPGIRDVDPTLPTLPPRLPSNALTIPLRVEEGGWRYVLLKDGPDAFAKAIRQHPRPLIMDTTFRDAHQSLLATRLRTYDMARIAPLTSHCFKHAYSIEMWGGATFDVSMRFLHECPWDRLRELRALCPNIPFQMLLRGANAVGYTSYPDNVVYDFCAKARREGIDVFRVFDSLNYVENLKLGIDAVRKAGGVVEAAICYTGNVADETRKRYNTEYYLKLVDQLVGYGIHVLAIKDMAGLLTPPAARILVGAIRQAHPELPIHVHTHDTAGSGVASMLACVEAGADVIDLAIDSMSGVTSQPCMGAVVASLAGTEKDLGIKFDDVQLLNGYWEQVRFLYKCFDPQVNSPSSEVLEHEMPGGQYTNLLFQSHSLGLGDQWGKVKKAYMVANKLCGDIVKVTPSSKVVGDFAQFIVSNNLTEQEVLDRADTLSFPKSVVEYYQGYLGQPPYGFPEPLRTKIIRSLPRIDGRPGVSMSEFDFAALKESLSKKFGAEVIRDVDLSSAAQYPAVFDEFMKNRDKYGDLSILPTRFFLSPLSTGEEINVNIEPGKTLIIKLLAVSVGGDGEKDVFFQLNGSTRVIRVADKAAVVERKQRPKANTSHPGEVGAPMPGMIVEIRTKPGAKVNVGDPICIMSAMKMETVVGAPVSGRVEEVIVAQNDSLTAGDLICRITTAGK